MAGLGAGAGAAARIEFEEKLAEQQRQANMRAAQNAAAMREQSRQFDERQRAAAEERDHERARQARLDNAAAEERAFQRGRAERADERLARLDERQARLDQLALEDRDYRRGRDAAADARQQRLDEIHSEGQRIANDTARAKYDELTRLLDEQQMKRENLRASISGAERSIVRFLVENPGLAQKDGARFADFLTLANNQLGTKFTYMGLLDNGGIYAESPALDENGKQILDDVKDAEGNVVGKRKRMTPFFVAPEKVREVAGSEGFDWDNMTKSYAAREVSALDAAKLETERAKADLYGARANAIRNPAKETAWTPSEVAQIWNTANKKAEHIESDIASAKGELEELLAMRLPDKKPETKERYEAQVRQKRLEIKDLEEQRKRVFEDAAEQEARGRGQSGGGSSFSRAVSGGAQGSETPQGVEKWFIDDPDE